MAAPLCPARAGCGPGASQAKENRSGTPLGAAVPEKLPVPDAEQAWPFEKRPMTRRRLPGFRPENGSLLL